MAATGSVVVRRSAERFNTVADGVRTRHLLSFGDHYDPTLTSLGPLIAHNDEVVEPGAGYAPHRHRGVEIVTWVVDGRLSHRDEGGEVLLESGSAQLLSAGAGITHEESADVAAIGPTRFVQMWLPSDDPEAAPHHTAANFDDRDLRTSLVPIAAGAATPERQSPSVPLPLGVRGAVCLVGRVAAGSTRALPAAGFAHMFVVDGDVSLSVGDPGDIRLAAGDSVLVFGAAEATCVSLTDAEIVVWTWNRDPTAQQPG